MPGRRRDWARLTPIVSRNFETMTKSIAVLAYPDCQLLDVAGPLQVYATATQRLPAPAYEVRVLAPEAGPAVNRSSASRGCGSNGRSASSNR